MGPVGRFRINDCGLLAPAGSEMLLADSRLRLRERGHFPHVNPTQLLVVRIRGAHECQMEQLELTGSKMMSIRSSPDFTMELPER